MTIGARHVEGVLVACFALAMVAAVVPATAQHADLPKPVRVPPVPMPALPAAVIDDALAIGGEEIDARKVRSRMTIAVEVNGTGPYRFVVDSGADSSVIGTRIAKSLQLPKGTPVTLNGMTGTSIVPRVLVDELGLGKESVSDLELPVLAENDLGGDGMLGIDALAEERLMLDFEKRLITVEDASKPPPRMDGEIVVTARRRRGQLILTEVRANGKTINAVVDTGSEISIGNSALREQIIRRGAKLEKVEMTGVTGVTVELDLAIVNDIRLGSVILRNVPIAFADVPPFTVFGLTEQPAMLLGTDLMETFRRVSLDFRARKVRFQLRKCESQGILISTSSTTSFSRLGVEKGTTEACKR
ncbi:MAG: aspartyl protease family protein [Sphingomonadaceae bacterium]|nr:aspartyl protease family protein [Sphingomonadaceae bacterium]